MPYTFQNRNRMLLSATMDDDPKLAAIDQQIAQLKARKARLVSRRKSEDRKRDARRKIIAGALALEHAKHDPAFGAALQNVLDRYVTRQDERALFGLAPLPRQDEAAPPTASAVWTQSSFANS